VAGAELAGTKLASAELAGTRRLTRQVDAWGCGR